MHTRETPNYWTIPPQRVQLWPLQGDSRFSWWGREYGSMGVAPGPIWTPLIPASFKEEETAQFGGQVPMKRAGQPIEVAPSYVFLACNQCSSYITGQVLHPNGNYNTKLNVSKYIYCIRNIICTSICISLLTLACLFLQGEPL